MSKIARLSESVINQIAAGEVVEHPASVIKELIENSLDAGASSLRVEVRGGGHLFILVEDDGCGMGQEDALLSLERHATSKIRSTEDLFALSSMGFRGEALAAISAVSHFELKTSEGTVGTWIRSKGGVVEEITPLARNRGTSIEIRSLFFNVPARKKFQKSSRASLAQISRVVETMSLAHPFVAFSLYSEGEKIFDVRPQTQKERIDAVVGRLPLEAKGEGLVGFFGEPQEAKSHRREQLLFVNQRPIFSPFIAKAVQMGYGTRLGEHSYPSFVLFLEVDPQEVDVNVHPQKREIRFAKESLLFDKVLHCVEGMFVSKAPVFSASPISFAMPTSFLLEESPPALSPQEESPPLPLAILERPLLVKGRYFFLEKEGLYLIDLVALRSRLFFDALSQPKIETQPLLWPLEYEMDDPEGVERLEKMGFECRLIGKKKIAVDAVPSLLDVSEVPRFLEVWKEGKDLRMITSSFCGRLDRRYSPEEALYLWRCLQNCADRLYDPLGKKIWIRIEADDLAKWMMRG